MGLIVSFNFLFTVHHKDLLLRPLTPYYYFFSIGETYCKANNLLCHARYEFSWWLGEIYWGDFTRIKRKLMLQSTNEQIKLYEGSNKTKNKYILRCNSNRIHRLYYPIVKPFTLLPAHIVNHECISILWKQILMMQGNSFWKCCKTYKQKQKFSI